MTKKPDAKPDNVPTRCVGGESKHKGKVESGQLCTVAPVQEVGKGDIVLCKVGGKQYLHLVTAVHGDRYQISNNRGHVNGWVGRDCIYGKLVRLEA